MPAEPTAGTTGTVDAGDAQPPRRTAAEARALLDGVEWTPGIGKPDPIMVVDSMVRSFGGLVAVDVEHLEIPRGCITGLIGPNGAGKTTLFNLLTGFDRPNQGTWTYYDRWNAQSESWDGRSLSGLASYKMARLGVVRTFQLTKALAKLTVLENMRLGAVGQTGEKFLAALVPPLWRAEEKRSTERAMELLARFKLDAKAKDFAGTLSGGQRKLLEMARALMVSPQVVMLDEPMAGVNPALAQSLLEHVKSLRDEGMTVIFVEHDMDVVREISDWVVVMAQGKIIAEGPPHSIAQNSDVVDAYLGAHHDQPLTFEEEQAALAAANAEIAAQSGLDIDVLATDDEAALSVFGRPAQDPAEPRHQRDTPSDAEGMEDER